MGPNNGLNPLYKSINYLALVLHRSDIQFILIGGGDLQPDLVQVRSELGLDEFVTFTGRIPGEKGRKILTTANTGGHQILKTLSMMYAQ